VADVRSASGVAAVAEAAAVDLRLTTSPDATAMPEDATAVGFDDTFVGHGSPPLAERAPGLTSDDAAFRLVARDATKVVVGADLDADAVSGFVATRPHLGDVVRVRDPESGATRTLTVAGIAHATRYDGRPHIYLARSAVDTFSSTDAGSNLLFVQTTPGTNDDTLAAIIDGTHLQNGTYARSFVRLARETLSTREQFLDVAAAYAAVGLVAVLLGIAVLMTDRVRARRRQTAMLRALGFPRRSLVRASRIEALAIMLEGCFVGVLSGLLVAGLLVSSDRLGTSLSVAVPFASLSAVVIAVLAASSLAAGLATSRASHRLPAAALRDER
jgi:ABC-type lipoprotein release transport system permease subunit